MLIYWINDLLRLAAFKREEYLKSERYKNKLNKEEGYSEGKEEGYSLGKEEGIAKGALESKKDSVIQLFEINYPQEDSSFLNNLTLEQYDSLFLAIAKKESIETIKLLAK